MSQLKFDLNKNDYLAPKTDPKDVHFVVKITLHEVVLRKEMDDSIFALPKRVLNLAWTKVDPEVAKVLYDEMKLEKN